MNAQMIVCDCIRMNKEEKFHELGRVLNAIKVDTFPSIYTVSVFIKLFSLSMAEEIESYLKVLDEDGNVVAFVPNLKLRNYREEDQVPGIDMSIDIDLLICQPGIYTFVLYVNDLTIASYPLTVRFQGVNNIVIP